jgi:threonine dehydratase
VGENPVVYDDFSGCFLKLECESPSGSHKDRETLYLIEKFGWDKQYIVISSGNAGISLAYWMREKAVVLTPEITPEQKIEAIRRFGAKVIVKGKYYYESYRLVDNIAKKEGLINISPGFVERWRGDIPISYEIKELDPEYVFVPAANHTLALGIAHGFQEMHNRELIKKTPEVISCVLPNHPFIKLTQEIKEHYKKAFNSIYTHGGEGENLRKEFLNFSFTKVESTLNLDSVLKLSEKYSKYDPAVSLAIYVSKFYKGRKIVIATGVKR